MAHLFLLFHQLDPSGEMHLLDSSSAVRPAVSSTWFIAFIKSFYLKVFKSVKKDADTTDADAEDDDQSSLTDSDAARNGISISKENGIGGRAPAVKAGGKRKRATKKRQ